MFKGKRVTVKNNEIFNINSFEKIADLKIKIDKVTDSKDLAESQRGSL